MKWCTTHHQRAEPECPDYEGAIRPCVAVDAADLIAQDQHVRRALHDVTMVAFDDELRDDYEAALFAAVVAALEGRATGVSSSPGTPDTPE